MRIKTWGNGRGGICDYDDSNTSPDSGRKCPDWKGIKYKRTKEKNYVVD